MWGSVTSTVAFADTCRKCPARTDCARAVKALEPVRCEDVGAGLAPAPPARSHRARNPLKSKYARALEPGQQFTVRELATRAGAGETAARQWVYDATHAGIVALTGTLSLNSPTGGAARLYRFIPVEISP
jgi:hypothetical protein